MTILEAFRITTLSPQSACGVKFVLYFPLKIFAILEENLPKF